VLDLNATTGLLTWEALRRAPEGGVWALARETQDSQALQQQAERLPEIERPIVLSGDVRCLPDLLRSRGDQAVRFDAFVGRNVLTRETDKAAVFACLHAWLREDGILSLAEVVPRRTQRLSALIDLSALDDALVSRFRAAEANIYQNADDPLVNWDLPALEIALLESGFRLRGALSPEQWEEERQITDRHLARWFSSETTDGKLPYASRLLSHLTAAEVSQIEACFRQQLRHQVVPWQTTVVYLTALATGG
jgi:putative ATPase